jgi:hypothetical protein
LLTALGNQNLVDGQVRGFISRASDRARRDGKRAMQGLKKQSAD